MRELKDGIQRHHLVHNAIVAHVEEINTTVGVHQCVRLSDAVAETKCTDAQEPKYSTRLIDQPVSVPLVAEGKSDNRTENRSNISDGMTSIVFRLQTIV